MPGGVAPKVASARQMEVRCRVDLVLTSTISGQLASTAGGQGRIHPSFGRLCRLAGDSRHPRRWDPSLHRLHRCRYPSVSDIAVSTMASQIVVLISATVSGRISLVRDSLSASRAAIRAVNEKNTVISHSQSSRWVRGRNVLMPVWKSFHRPLVRRILLAATPSTPTQGLQFQCPLFLARLPKGALLCRFVLVPCPLSRVTQR
jgi:hypothetical protein